MSFKLIQIKKKLELLELEVTVLRRQYRQAIKDYYLSNNITISKLSKLLGLSVAQVGHIVNTGKGRKDK